MKRIMDGFRLSIIVASLLAPTAGLAVVVGQIDTFEDGTTNNWTVNLLGMGVHPMPPVNIASDGPAGANDNFMLLSSVGGSGPGSRMTAINISQWAGNYIAAGVGGIRMNLNNLGNADLDLRLLLSDPVGGPPANVAFSSTAIHLVAGSGWTSVLFPISLGDFTAAQGSVLTALTNATELRLFHGTAAAFPGESIVASLGVDNILAEGSTSVPETGATWSMLVAGLATIIGLARRRTFRRE